VTKDSLKYKNKLSPYEGMTVCGRVKQTYLRGNKVYDYSDGFTAPQGQLL